MFPIPPTPRESTATYSPSHAISLSRSAQLADMQLRCYYFLLFYCAGLIPHVLGALAELKVLKLKNNKLSGEILWIGQFVFSMVQDLPGNVYCAIIWTDPPVCSIISEPDSRNEE